MIWRRLSARPETYLGFATIPKSSYAALVLVAVQVVAVASRIDLEDNDSVQYYVGAYNLWTCGDPYAASASEINISRTSWRYCYPPMLAFLWLPSAALSVSHASMIWFLINVVLTAVLAGQLAQVLRIKSWLGATPLIMAGLLLYPPQIIGLILGQSHTLLAVLLVGSYLLARGGRQSIAGLLLGIATAIKWFPAFLMLGYFASRWRQAALAALTFTVVWTVATWRFNLSYIQQFVLPSEYPYAAAFNISIIGVASRLFRASDYATPVVDAPVLFGIVVGTAVAAILGGVIYLAVRRSNPSRVVTACLCGMLLLSPIAGIYHLNLLVGAVAIYWQDIGRSNGWRWPCFLAAILLVTAVPPEFGLLGNPAGWAQQVYRFIHTGLGVLLLTPQTFAIAALFGSTLMFCGANVSYCHGNGGASDETRQ